MFPNKAKRWSYRFGAAEVLLAGATDLVLLQCYWLVPSPGICALN
jgi:hypothetical protein